MRRRALAAYLFERGWFRLARLIAWTAPLPTDRAHLLIAPEVGDRCEAFTAGPAHRDCNTDGHYLCGLCGRRILEEPCF